jgi:hypothetical protein
VGNYVTDNPSELGNYVTADKRMHHTIGDNIRARRKGLAAAIVRDRVAAGRRAVPVGRTLVAAQQQTINGHHRRCGW